MTHYPKNLFLRARVALFQSVANTLVKRAESTLDSPEAFLEVYTQAARLNAYAIVFYGIYLD